MMVPELLVALGVVPDASVVPLTTVDSSGTERTWSLPALEKRVPVDWRLPPAAQASAWMARRSEKYWSTLRDDGTLYVQFNSADIGTGAPEESFLAFTNAIVDSSRSARARRLVVDLRWNSGGSFVRAQHLLRALIRAEPIDQRDRLFVLISPETFSAAAALAADIGWHTHAIFVGAPTGGRPNAYGDVGRFTLPHSGIEIRYSRYYIGASIPEDTRPAVFPDLMASPTIADLRRGTDTAMAAVLAYHTRPSIRERIEPIARREGARAAITAWRRAQETQPNDFVFDVDALDDLGRVLFEEGKHDDGVAILRANADAYPWSAQAWSSLAEALWTSSNRPEALRGYQRAFELDHRYTQYRDRLREANVHSSGHAN